MAAAADGASRQRGDPGRDGEARRGGARGGEAHRGALRPPRPAAEASSNPRQAVDHPRQRGACQAQSQAGGAAGATPTSLSPATHPRSPRPPSPPLPHSPPPYPAPRPRLQALETTFSTHTTTPPLPTSISSIPTFTREVMPPSPSPHPHPSSLIPALPLTTLPPVPMHWGWSAEDPVVRLALMRLRYLSFWPLPHSIAGLLRLTDSPP